MSREDARVTSARSLTERLAADDVNWLIIRKISGTITSIIIQSRTVSKVQLIKFVNYRWTVVQIYLFGEPGLYIRNERIC
jgi:hypothetical protein